jgi:hypothetical protein
VNYVLARISHKLLSGLFQNLYALEANLSAGHVAQASACAVLIFFQRDPAQAEACATKNIPCGSLAPSGELENDFNDCKVRNPC